MGRKQKTKSVLDGLQYLEAMTVLYLWAVKIGEDYAKEKEPPFKNVIQNYFLPTITKKTLLDFEHEEKFHLYVDLNLFAQKIITIREFAVRHCDRTNLWNRVKRGYYSEFINGAWLEDRSLFAIAPDSTEISCTTSLDPNPLKAIIWKIKKL